MRCAVSKCKQSNSKKSTNGKSVAFYSFPKDPTTRKLWIHFCNRVNIINAQNERICALHFKQEDFERNMQFEMGFSSRRSPRLKPGAVPTIDPASTSVNCNKSSRTTANEIETFTFEEESIEIKTEFIDEEDSLQMQIQNLEMKRDALHQENEKLKMLQKESANTIKKLSSQVQSLSSTNENLQKALKAESQSTKLKCDNKDQNFVILTNCMLLVLKNEQ